MFLFNWSSAHIYAMNWFHSVFKYRLNNILIHLSVVFAIEVRENYDILETKTNLYGPDSSFIESFSTRFCFQMITSLNVMQYCIIIVQNAILLIAFYLGNTSSYFNNNFDKVLFLLMYRMKVKQFNGKCMEAISNNCYIFHKLLTFEKSHVHKRGEIVIWCGSLITNSQISKECSMSWTIE